MYTTIIHPIRVSLNLSLSEYCVLSEVYALSKNNERGNWCWKSKKNIALSLGISESKTYRHLNTLEEKGLIERNEQGHARTTDLWNDLISRKDYYIGLKNGDNSFISGVPGGEMGHCQNDSHTVKMTEGYCQNDSRDTVKMTYKNNIENNNENNIVSKDTSELSSQNDKSTKIFNSPLKEFSKEKEKSSAKKEKESYGNSDINKLLSALKGKVGVDEFVESAKMSRIWGHNCLTLMKKVGTGEFVRRLDILLEDSFHHKNCNKLSYIHRNIKGFIEPKKKKKRTGTVIN